jgi:hypothetical protein
MSPARLVRWARLDDQRRRRARRGPTGWPAWLWSLLFGAALAALVARRAGGLGAVGDAAAGGRLLATWAAALFLAVLCGAPFRIYWRRDAAMLARLPLPGRTLFGLALWRSLAATVHALLATAPAAVVIALAAPMVGARVAALLVALAALAGLAGPAVALAAGAVVASDQARAALASLSGELAAPRTSWLGALPALAGTGLVLLVIAVAPWVASGGDRRGPLLLAAAALASLAAAAWAWWAAARVMPAALREVAALDRERLAHVDRSTPSLLERSWSRLMVRDHRARLVAGKDAALLRRRHPAPYFIGPVTVIGLWIAAASGGAGAQAGELSVLAALAAYAALMARRSLEAPTEIPRLLATLPLSSSSAASAKRALAGLRALSWVGLAGAGLMVFHSGVVVVVAVAVLAVLAALAGTVGAAAALGPIRSERER